MDEYKSNSHKSKDMVPVEQSDERKISPVISGGASIQKKTGFGKIAESILAEDMKSVSSYILSDVLIPSFKKAIDDIVSNGIHMLLYGKSSGSKLSASKVSYGSYYYGGYGKSAEEPVRAGTSSSAFDYDNIVFDTRGDAEAVLETMENVIDQYGVVSVSDLYEMASIPAPSYTANKYGWTSLRSAKVFSVRDGYILRLPKAVEL